MTHHFPTELHEAQHPDDCQHALDDTLVSLLEFTGAEIGWIAVPDGGPGEVMAQRGEVPVTWYNRLSKELGSSAAQGTPVLLNELPNVNGDLRQVLAFATVRDGSPVAWVVLANKASGFTSYDAIALQSAVHLLQKRLLRIEARADRLLARVRRLRGNQPPIAVHASERIPLAADSAGESLDRDYGIATHEHACPRPRSWHALCLRPGQPVDYWDLGWEERTGIASEKARSVATEVLLDWLLPRQRDREFIAELLANWKQEAIQAYLEIAGRKQRRFLLCLFVPVPVRPAPQEAACQWLMVALEPSADPGKLALPLHPSFAAGLGRILNHYLTIPLGLAEQAGERSDLTLEVARWFEQILECCLPIGRLLEELQELTTTEAALEPVSLDQIVAELRAEFKTEAQEPVQEILLEKSGPELIVLGDARILRVVLRELIRNGSQAMADRDPRRITIRLLQAEEEAHIEVEDTGVGFSNSQGELCFLPFFSTKGAFAQNPRDAAFDAMGLGLTVCQHLMSLLGGVVEVSSRNGCGTVARVSLPAFVEQSAASAHASQILNEIRQDQPNIVAPGPHNRDRREATVG